MLASWLPSIENTLNSTHGNEKQLDESQMEIYRKESKLAIVKQDPYLHPYEGVIERRLSNYNNLISNIKKNEKSLVDFANSYKHMGIHYNEKDMSISFEEYAPGAQAISIVRMNSYLFLFHYIHILYPLFSNFFIYFVSLEILIFGIERSFTVPKTNLAFLKLLFLL